MVKILAPLDLILRETDLFSNHLSRYNCPQGGAAYPNIVADTPLLQAFAHLGSIA